MPPQLSELTDRLFRGPRQTASRVRHGELRRLRTLSWRDRALVFEALTALTTAAAIARFLPFRALTWWASRPPRLMQPDAAHSDAICRRVHWAVGALARRVPFRAVCLQQGLAAQFMLRRRGLPAVLCFGVAFDNGELTAHAWTQVSGVTIVGGEQSAGFTVIAAFPAG